jgi:hypothetical protein
MTAKPEVSVSVNPTGIPEELRTVARWVCWRYTYTDRWVKVPYQVNGCKASSTNAATWNTFDACFDAYLVDAYDGIGFVFDGSDFTGIDMDHCVGAGLSKLAQDVLDQVPGYAELSPSGAGLHIITRTAGLAAGSVKPGLEVYPKGRYFTMTGSQMNGHSVIPETPFDIAPFIRQHFDAGPAQHLPDTDDPLLAKTPAGRPLSAIRVTLMQLDPDMTEPVWAKVLWALHHETQGSPEGEALGLEWSANGAKFNEQAFADRWARARDSHSNSFTWRSVEKMAIAPLIKKPSSSSDPFPQFAWSEYQKGFESVAWIVKGVLPQAEFGVVFGASGSGKTFFALDLAATIARGDAWRGRKTSGGAVVYVAAEAREGIKKRLAAYDKEYGAAGARPRIMPNAPNLLSAEDAVAIVESTNKHGGAALIVIDTMAASHTGDENSTKDMGLFISLCKYVSEHTGAMVLVVHHTGKDDTKGLRGSSSIFAAADVVIEIFKNQELHAARITKQKDGEIGTEFGFTLPVVEVGQDADGDPITTCVVRESEQVPAKRQETDRAAKLAAVQLGRMNRTGGVERAARAIGESYENDDSLDVQ